MMLVQKRKGLLRFKNLTTVPSVYHIICTMIPPNNSLFVSDTVEGMTATLLSALLITQSIILLHLNLHLLFVRFRTISVYVTRTLRV